MSGHPFGTVCNLVPAGRGTMRQVEALSTPASGEPSCGLWIEHSTGKCSKGRGHAAPAIATME
jgi:hypothetical protein